MAIGTTVSGLRSGRSELIRYAERPCMKVGPFRHVRIFDRTAASTNKPEERAATPSSEGGKRRIMRHSGNACASRLILWSRSVCYFRYISQSCVLALIRAGPTITTLTAVSSSASTLAAPQFWRAAYRGWSRGNCPQQLFGWRAKLGSAISASAAPSVHRPTFTPVLLDESSLRCTPSSEPPQQRNEVPEIEITLGCRAVDRRTEVVGVGADSVCVAHADWPVEAGVLRRERPGSPCSLIRRSSMRPATCREPQRRQRALPRRRRHDHLARAR
jgi:hypothetical protein